MKKKQTKKGGINGWYNVSIPSGKMGEMMNNHLNIKSYLSIENMT